MASQMLMHLPSDTSPYIQHVDKNLARTCAKLKQASETKIKAIIATCTKFEQEHPGLSEDKTLIARYIMYQALLNEKIN